MSFMAISKLSNLSFPDQIPLPFLIPLRSMRKGRGIDSINNVVKLYIYWVNIVKKFSTLPP